jgi:dTDP-4-amino-4,6-dideoxygalactose transaminase
MTVAFLDLARQSAALADPMRKAIDGVIRRGRYILGEEGAAFEEEFAQACEAEHAVGVASGTDALTIALQAVGVLPGDEVITVANTCVPTIVGIEQTGATPVLVDVERDTFTLDPVRVAEAVTARTTAVVPVHLYGQCADMKPLLALAQRHGLAVVEDCAQSHGARYRGRRAGSFGDAAAFSFYPTKNLGALGDAGAIITNRRDIAEAARHLRNYGERERFEHIIRGRNSRLDELQVAVLRVKLPFLNEWNERRRTIAAQYNEALGGSEIVAPVEARERHHVYHLYVIQAHKRAIFRARLSSRGIGTAIHYPTPVHLQPAYRDLAPTDRSLTLCEELAGTILSVPLYPELTDTEVEEVSGALAETATDLVA